MFWPRFGFVSALVICLAALAAGPARDVTAAPAWQQGQAAITAPASNSKVSGVVQVTGSATHPDFQRYELAWADDPNKSDSWVVFATIQASIENGVLATWNTTQVPDGLYILRLRVVRKDGNYDEVIVRGVQVANSSQPEATPTALPGPTIPPEPTIGVPALPTPELIIQPPTSTPQPPTPTPASSSTSDSGAQPLGATSFNINFGTVQQSFCNGIVYTFGLFFVWGVLLSIRSIIRWVLRRAARQGSRGTGE
jgi:hypothetical protein